MFQRVVIVCTAAFALAVGVMCPGCDQTHPDNELRIFAASSLVDVFAEAVPAFEAERPGVQVTTSIAGSQILASQLLEGADADVFASADHVQMKRVESLFGPPVDFAANRLVVITASGQDLTTLQDLSRPGLRIVLASQSVPAGRYTVVALQSLGLLETIEPNVVSYEHDVRGVLMKVLLGEADAGVVYATDAASAGGNSLRAFDFPPESSVRVTYPIALHNNTHDWQLAQSFIEFMRTGEGATILRRHGFEIP